MLEKEKQKKPSKKNVTCNFWLGTEELLTKWHTNLTYWDNFVYILIQILFNHTFFSLLTFYTFMLFSLHNHLLTNSFTYYKHKTPNYEDCVQHNLSTLIICLHHWLLVYSSLHTCCQALFIVWGFLF